MAETYIFLATRRLSGQPWKPQAFRMAHFIETYCGEKIGGNPTENPAD
jgi:hypothetical protein